MNEIFDPDGAGPEPPLQPLARYSAGQIVATASVVLTIPVFIPGAFATFAANSPTHPYADMAASNLGYVAAPILQDLTRPETATAITDFCSPVDLTSLLFGEARQNPCNGNTLPPCNSDALINNPTPGAPTGRIRWQNPSSAGTNYFGTYQFSLRDVDHDGIENSLDTCPYNANSDGDPRLTAGPDGDVLDSSCDPQPGTNTPNQDGDTAPNGIAWQNSGDNCPQIANPTQAESERSEPSNVSRPRGGTATDSLGDACDGAEVACGAAIDDDSDGLVNDGCPTVGGPTPEVVCGNPAYDDDGDGYANDGCPAVDPAEDPADCANAADDDADGRVNDGCPAVVTAESDSQCTNTSDDDLDGAINGGCPNFGPNNPETGAQCENTSDEDADTFVNDGCPPAGPLNPEAGPACANYSNDGEADGFVNDGCPSEVGPELGCLNSVDDEDRPDTAASDGDGAVNDGCPSSSRVANGHYHTDFDLLAVCIGATDTDGDGYCAIGSPSDPMDSDSAVIPETYSQFRPFALAHSGSGNDPPASREPVQICSDGEDNDGDGLIDLLDGTIAGGATADDCRPPDSIFTSGPDTDGDGSKDEVEIHVGTDHLARCCRGRDAMGVIPNKQWPIDMRGETNFSADRVNVQDIATFTNPARRLGSSPGDTKFDRRWDLRPGASFGAWIGITDLAPLANNAPIPMFGVRPFNGPHCSAHPVCND